MSGKLFVFAMDSGDPDLLNLWMDSGDLPALAAIRAAGTSAICTCPSEMGNGTMWQTLVTGVNMARHGLHYIKQQRPGSYLIDVVDEDQDCEVPSIWARMSAAGRRRTARPRAAMRFSPWATAAATAAAPTGAAAMAEAAETERAAPCARAAHVGHRPERLRPKVGARREMA